MPRSRIVDLIAAVEEISTQFAVQIGVFGHAGDGNLHPTIIFNDADPDSRAAARHAFDCITGQALALVGTLTGEHGVGLLKRSGWPSSSRTSRWMSRAALKSVLDPTGILNPAKVFDAAGRPDARRDH